MPGVLDRETERNPSTNDVDAELARIEGATRRKEELERQDKFEGSKQKDRNAKGQSTGSGKSAGKSGTKGGGAAGGAAVKAALAGEGAKGIAQSAASAWIVNAAIIALLDFFVSWTIGSVALIYLNIHWILSAFGFKWFRPLAIWQKAIVIMADLLVIILAVLIIAIPLTIVYVGCNPMDTVGGITGAAIGIVSYIYFPKGICEAFDGVFSAVGTVVNKGTYLMCSTPQVLAQQNNNAAYPAQTNPDVQEIIDCVKSKPGLSGIPTYTYEVRDQGEPVNQEFCNYTRGGAKPECGVTGCAHSLNSCHYGGAIGSTGSLAVDFDFPGSGAVIGPQILQAVIACSSQLGIPLKRSVCETSTAAAVPCANVGATHTHTSIAKCDKDNSQVNSE